MVTEMNIYETVHLLNEMMRWDYFISHLKRCREGGLVRAQKLLIMRKLHHRPHNGKEIHFDLRDEEEFQEAVLLISRELLGVVVKDEPQTKENSPLFYGEDFVSKFKVLGKCLSLPYLFITTMGKNVRWQKYKLSDKSGSSYNKFKPEEIDQINDAIRTMAIKLASIKIIPMEKKD